MINDDDDHDDDNDGDYDWYRFGFLNPINYNDNELFCGGVDTQVSI